jgi:peptidoglycan/LPS O-acetylase OafA/YrhL
MSIPAATDHTQMQVSISERQSAPQQGAGQRISALDFTKGALVLIMVLYHWINYFIGPQWPYYFYLRFLTPSFILITGFMISHIYLSKYDTADPRLPKRLFVRGLKLFAIFIALNLSRAVVLPTLSTGTLAAQPLATHNLLAIFITGNMPSTNKLVSFSILIPIAYLLVLCALLVFPYRSYKYTFHVVCLFLLLLISVLAFWSANSANLEMVTIGLLGTLIGFTPIRIINNLAYHSFVLILAYFSYLACITKWNVPFPLLIIGVCLTLTIIYRIGIRESQANRLYKIVTLLGKYSLFGYIFQIVVLQMLYAGFRYFDRMPAVWFASFPAAFLLTLAGVQGIDRARKAEGVDKLYKTIFA